MILLALITSLLLTGSAWATHLPSLNDILAPAETVGDVHVDWVPQPGVSTLDCLAKVEAVIREHDALDEATLALQREYSITPGWLHDIAPQYGNICLSLGGTYRCGDDANWPREITKYSIEQAEKQVEEDKKLLAKREAYYTEKARKERLLEQRHADFIKQWESTKRECWRRP